MMASNKRDLRETVRIPSSEEPTPRAIGAIEMKIGKVGGEKGASFEWRDINKFSFLEEDEGGVCVHQRIFNQVTFVAVSQTSNIPGKDEKGSTRAIHNKHSWHQEEETNNR